jgi:hypothetical protein
MRIRSEPFWMIYGEGQNSPAVRHENFEAAKRESERLARNNPGIRFFILATVGVTERNDVTYRSIDPLEIPF